MNELTYKKQIEKIIDGINILSYATYEVLGSKKFVKNQTPYSNFSGDFKSFGSNTVIDKSKQRQNLVNAITNTVYTNFYCGVSVENDIQALPSKTEREEYMNQLSEANKSEGGIDYNWTIYNIDPSGNAFVKKNEELRWLQPNGYQYQNPHQKQPILHTKVNITKTKESKSIQPVFYHVFSNEMFPQESELCRIYWNIKFEGANSLIEQLTSTLNDYKIPFQFKCLNHPELYVRSDSAVLYIDKKHLSILLILLKAVIAQVEDFLVDQIPMFTYKLHKGVGYAEDPGKGMSFGMSRSMVIAESLVDSFVSKKNEEDATQSVFNALKEKGISLDRIHLNNQTILTPNFPNYE